MNRRTFAAALAAGAASACLHGRPTPGARIRAVAFDLFTIFDPRSIDAVTVAELADEGAAIAALWKLRTFEYCWLRAASDQYAPFDEIVDAALTHALASHRRDVSGPVRRRLLASWTELSPWPDSETVLAQLQDRGLMLAPLANYAPTMIASLLAHAGLSSRFGRVFSTAAARTFKPARRAYQVAADGLGLPSSAIAFSAFGGWDAAGGTWFGYPTFWVNRLGVAGEQLSASPDAVGPDLVALAAWVTQRDR